MLCEVARPLNGVVPHVALMSLVGSGGSTRSWVTAIVHRLDEVTDHGPNLSVEVPRLTREAVELSGATLPG